jgi:hypothetical protein
MFLLDATVDIASHVWHVLLRPSQLSVLLFSLSLSLSLYRELTQRIPYTAYQQPVKYNFTVVCEVLKQVYTAERLQLPALLGSVFGTYTMLWAHACSIGYQRDVVKSGEWACLGVYAVEVYGIFKVPVFFFRFPPLSRMDKILM